MVVTVEMIVMSAGFIGILLTNYLNTRKYKNDSEERAIKAEEALRDELQEEIGWRTKTTLMLETVIRNSEEARINQGRIDDMVRKHGMEISQINHDIKDIYGILDRIQIQIPKRSGDNM